LTSAGLLEPGIEGVSVARLDVRHDDRGSFVELYRRSALADVPPMVQANLSRSEAGVLRGMHFHRRQADLWLPVGGRATVGLFDLRAGSASRGRAVTLELDAREPVGLYIPPGVAHGFATVAPWAMLYLVDREYGGGDEEGFAWDDPDLGLAWPVRDPVLSERDRSSPSLETVLADPPALTDAREPPGDLG
jgi:dTDP-4-dehydrorhamnose 3,5-epimerase